MYKHQTYEAILSRMLDRVPGDVDKREGSIIYDALAPAAAEMAQMYVEMDIDKNLSFADTSSGEYLERRTAEFGVTRHAATKARRLGMFSGQGGAPVDVPIGSRFAIGELTYVATSKITTGSFVLECERAGMVGNQQFGALLPIDYLDGLVTAELADVLVPGEDAESDEDLRKRYLATITQQSFGGNAADYKEKIESVPGVGGVKVYPVWQGGGTVKCTIIASDYSVPSATLIDEVQTLIDPEVNQGEGLGLAPIGHVVTITGASAVTINVATTLTLATGTTPGMVQADVEAEVAAYLLSLRTSWKDQQSLVVRISQIEARILNVSGVVDVTGTTLNGTAANITLNSDEIPTLGTVTINV
ncbi:phage tail protein [Tumebacillus algifaecis]|uniref:Phage tail protein n=1 Tax=Tumebacillus algifaecis TaxID=1214604 RepID=A0A223D5D7_9BACL|nr:baseplate J/gp47 family protein [Tumebacillus algifaecis]ASS76808.1 phage tail protein [Tumebacillus algifaecis]